MNIKIFTFGSDIIFPTHTSASLMVAAGCIFIWQFPCLCSIAHRDSEAQVQHHLDLEAASAQASGGIHVGLIDFNHLVQLTRCGVLFKGYTPLY